MDGQAPEGPPPSYLTATGSASQQPTSQQRSRSEEPDYERLPRGWVCRIDKRSDRKYYVDTAADPPRSIWHHPLDDDEYLDSLVPEDEDEHEHEHERGFADGNEEHNRQKSHLPYPDELPAREHQAGPSDGSTGSKNGFSGWASRFGHGVEDNFRYRQGMQPKAREPNAAIQTGGSRGDVDYLPPPHNSYYDGRNYNAGPDIMVMGRGRRARGVYIDDQGYSRMSRRRRGGLIRTAINATMSDNEKR